ncbi:hypothetical protein TNCT_57111 [Trichonephila clavata]|uniref:Uncharacterized protein n=1 Tax=Trichonephila clavata TaxID=2740835 RepID=A0A8X6FEG8_TRICU|nr:hypothetical protein TNCT_57111 [Trichonephila clavata]
MDKEAIPSITLPFLLPTKMLKWARKSMSIIVLVTSATTRGQLNALLSTKSNLSNFCPKVLILVPLAAKSSSLTTDRFSYGVGGTTEISASVSIKNWVLVFVLNIKSTHLHPWAFSRLREPRV